MSDFYQSQADKLRFEILLKSLREGRLNLAILGEDEAALTHYGKRIFQHLRHQGEPNVELWTSADSDRLVDRFNDILSSLTVDQALDKTNQTAPKRYMIFPDTHGIQDFELQLLARLVNGFPASNINVILLINSRSAYDKKLAAFGKNLLQWVLESETPSLAKPARLETLEDWPGAKQVTSEEKKAVSPMEDVSVSLPPVPPPPLDLSENKSSVKVLPDVFKDPEMGLPVELTGVPSGEELAKSWEANPASSVRRGAWAWVSLLVLLTLLTALAFINQDRVLQEWESMRAYLSGVKPTAETTEDTQPPATPVPPTPTVSMSSSSTTVVKPTEALSPGKEELVVPSSPETAVAATIQSSAPAPAPAPVSAATPPTPVSETARAEPAASVVVAPSEKSDKTKEADNPNWVAKLDPNAWVMQHGAFDSLNEARQFQSTSIGFKSGQVLFTQRKGSKPYYILVTGPYADKTQAQALMKDNPLLTKAWLRT
ncbi:MAG: SPOR domain-containing protein, partial [Limnohabitans sp.]